MAKPIKEEIVNILLESNLLTKEQLDEALKLQKEGKGKLRDILISKGYVKQEDLMAALSQKLGIPPISLSKIKIDKETIKLISREIAKRYQLIPVSKIGNTLTIAMADPLNVFAIDDLKTLTNYVIKPVISNEEEITKAIDKYYGTAESKEFSNILQEMDKTGAKAGGKDEAPDTKALLKLMGEKPVVKVTNLILTEAIKRQASDVLIEPQEDKTLIRYRVDGLLQESPEVPKSMHAGIISRLKVMSNLNIAEHRLPQDGRFKVKVQDREVDYRVSVLPSSQGEKIALRVLDKATSTLEIDKLGFEGSVLDCIKRNANRPHGMIIVCGPTGCGKTTTLYAILNFIDSPAKNLVTVEDPVEYELEGVNQVTSLPDIGLSFASALRSILRQDPDIIMVGEIRDFETVDVAIKAALTGHLVLSTLHTTTAAGSVIRLVDMGVEPFLITSSCLLFMAQRLVRRLCPECKQEYQVTDAVVKSLNLNDFRKKFDVKVDKFYRSTGCSKCRSTGYSGRTVIAEALELSAAIKDLIVKRRPESDIIRQAREEGMKTLREIGIIKAAEGITSVEEILRVTAE